MAAPQTAQDGDDSHDHLVGLQLPSIALPSTSGSPVNLSELSGLTVLFGYPKNGNPNFPKNPEAYNELPGVKGCTAQACSFRDASDDLLSLGVSHVFGISTQSTSYQQELKDRERLPYQFLSDENLELTKTLPLPTHVFQDQHFLKRFNMVIEDGKVVKVLHAVPAKSASEIADWLQKRPQREKLSTDAENELLRNLQHRK